MFDIKCSKTIFLLCYFLFLFGTLELTFAAGSQLKFDPLESSTTSEFILDRQLPSAVKNGRMNFRFRVDQRCSFGDFDAILFDAVAGLDSRMILSIEPILSSKNTQALAQVNITPYLRRMAETTDELEIGFDLSAFSENTLIGLFICKDDEMSGSCRKKPYKDINEVLSAYEFGKTQSPNVRPADKIYFFRPFMLKGNDLTMLKQELSPTKELALSKVLNLDSKDQTDYQQLQKINLILGSLPLDYVRDAIVINLPRYSTYKCRGKA